MHTIICQAGIQLTSVFSPITLWRQMNGIHQVGWGMMLAHLAVIFPFCLLFFVLQLKKDKKKVWKEAMKDPLTGTPNINGFTLQVEQILAENPDRHFTIFMFDISQFKLINDLYGFDTGSQVIKILADQAYGFAQSPFSVLTRIYADQFMLFRLCDFPESDEHCRFQITERTQTTVFEMLKIRVDLRFGRYTVPLGTTDVQSVIQKVHIAHQRSKQERGGKFFDYDEIFRNQLIEEIQLETQMEQALQNREFAVYLQPKYELSTSRLAGAESLVRWVRQNGVVIPPIEFIPLFEKNGFVVKIDMYVLEETCRIVRSWLDRGLQAVPVSVNFSRIHLENPDFVDEIDSVVKRYRIAPYYIEIELTESIMFNNEQLFSHLLERLHQKGYRITMDDFGSGYSSLGLLKNLHVDVIKIDSSFFANSISQERTKHVIESVMEMAKKLDIRTVAEGVENIEDVNLLQEAGCDLVQGYYYSKPIPAIEFTRKLEQMKKS